MSQANLFGAAACGIAPHEASRPAHFEDARLRLDKWVVGPYDNNVYVIRCKSTGQGVLLDAANEHDLIVPVARAAGVRRVFATHGHWDHIQAVNEARDAGIDVGVGAGDSGMLPGYDFVVDDEEVLMVGDLTVRARHTPGHTPGSTCFVIDGYPFLFTGDTLFPGGPGRTDFGGDFPTIIRSIDERLFTLPADTVVFPGHGLNTTIGTERPHLQEWADRGW
jgi:glyoxylase-like metal-dependent hydrolase (beta-lactamase superfamily II)